MKYPPGLVVTRQVVTYAFSQKLEDRRSYRLHRMKNIANPTLHRKFGDHIRPGAQI